MRKMLGHKKVGRRMRRNRRKGLPLLLIVLLRRAHLDSTKMPKSKFPS